MKNTYFGIASLLTALLSVLSLAANFGASQLNITPETFSFLNNITVLTACVLAPLAVLLGMVGLLKRNDSKLLSVIALVLVGAPFLILFLQMIFSIETQRHGVFFYVFLCGPVAKIAQRGAKEKC